MKTRAPRPRPHVGRRQRSPLTRPCLIEGEGPHRRLPAEPQHLPRIVDTTDAPSPRRAAWAGLPVLGDGCWGSWMPNRWKTVSFCSFPPPGLPFSDWPSPLPFPVTHFSPVSSPDNVFLIK